MKGVIAVKKILLITITLCICIVLIVYSNDSKKEASSIKLPDVSDIKAVQIVKEGQTIYQANSEWIKELTNEISSSKITNIQSISDAPTNVNKCIQINFVFETGASTIFLYEKQSGFNKLWYIEQPYNSICIANDTLIEMLN